LTSTTLRYLLRNAISNQFNKAITTDNPTAAMPAERYPLLSRQPQQDADTEMSDAAQQPRPEPARPASGGEQQQQPPTNSPSHPPNHAQQHIEPQPQPQPQPQTHQPAEPPAAPQQPTKQQPEPAPEPTPTPDQDQEQDQQDQQSPPPSSDPPTQDPQEEENNTPIPDPGPRAQRLKALFETTAKHTLDKISKDNFEACFPTVAAKAPGTLEFVQRQMVGRLGGLWTVCFLFFLFPPFVYGSFLGWSFGWFRGRMLGVGG
jgi:hypothetical protein